MIRRSWFHRVIAAVVTVVLGATGLVALDAAPSGASGGDLDPGFGVNGIRQQAASGAPFAARVAAFDQTFGRLLVGGSVGPDGAKNSSLARFSRDGQPDLTFPGGAAGTSWDATGAGEDDELTGVAWDGPTGDIYTASFSGATLDGSTAVLQRRDALDLGTIAQTLPIGTGSRETQLRIWDQKLYSASTYSVAGGPDFDGVRVRRYDLSTGSAVPDMGFGSDGEAIFDFGSRAVFQAMEVDEGDGSVYIGAHTGSSALLGRMRPTGVADDSFGASGIVSIAGDLWITSIALGNSIAVAGPYFISGVPSGGHVEVFDYAGNPASAFDGDGARLFPGSIIWSVAWDFDNRLQFALESGGVAGRVLDDGSDDGSFGSGGRSAPACPGGRIIQVLNDVTQPVIAGDCGGQMFLARFQADQWRLFTYQISAEAPAGRGQIPLDAQALQALATLPAELQATPLRGTPLRGTPLRGTPLRGTPLRGTPLRGTPLRGTPLRGTALQTPLSAIPLNQDTPADPTWADVLRPTVYNGVPLTNVTLSQVLALSPLPTDPLAGITLSDIPLRGTPLRGTSVTSLLLGQIPLAELPVEGDDWCAYLATIAGSPTCAPGGSAVVDPTTWTLLDLELAGADLADYYATPIQLRELNLAGSVLGDTRVADLDLPATPFGTLPVASLRTFVSCTTCAPSLGGVQQANIDHIVPTATLAQLITASLQAALLPGGISLGEILPGLVRSGDLPIEELPLEPLLDRAPVETDPARTFYAEVDYELQCRSASDVEPDLRIDLPAGGRFVPGSQEFDPPGPALFTGAALPTTVVGQQVIFDLPDICTTNQVLSPTVSFEIDPPVTIGYVDSSSATLFRSAFSETVSAQPFSEADDAAAMDKNEPADNLEVTATPLVKDVVYTGHLSQPGDVDLYRIQAPPAGSTLSVSISHLPADYDLTIYGAGDELPTTPLRGTPLRGTPLRGTAVGDSLGEPGADGSNAPAEGLADIPLRGTPLRGTSINRGNLNESVSVLSKAADATATPAGFLVQVSGFDGAHSNEPYVLRARVTPGPTPAPCAPRSVPFGDAPAGDWPTTIPDDVGTLFLVNQQRLGARYGVAAAAAAVQRLIDLAGRPDVNGVVLPVEDAPGRSVATKYTAWDQDPCSVAGANAVVNEINNVVDDLRPTLPTLRHIVLVGTDEVLPQARIPDLTRLANQSDYTQDVRYRDQDNAISRAFLEGNILSDEPYGDFDPQPWLSGKLFVSDVGLGRLVETPADIEAAVDRFFSSDGTLAPASSYVTGYDFLTDGAQAVAGSLAGLSTDANRVVASISEEWTAADAAAGVAGAVGGVAAVNAHYNHYQALPAEPFTTGSTAEEQLFVPSQLPTSLLNTILFTMGCEAGLNVADVLIANPTAAEAKSLRDWAQAVSTKGGVFAGNTGYGYGDTEAVAYSERLMANFAGFLAGRNSSVGQAMMFAKQRYQAELGVAGVYDAKAMEEATFYGLPMYRIGAGGMVADPVIPDFEPAPVSAGVTATPLDEPFAFTAASGQRGTHYEVTGEEPQVTHARPIQPRFDREYPITSAGRIHGLVIEDLVSRDLANINPVYNTPTVDLAANEPEATTRSSVFPAALQSVSSKSTPAGRKDVVVLMPGQFFGNAGGSGLGTQRLFDRIQGQVLRSSSTDFDAPVITAVDAIELGGVARIDAFSDNDDIVRGVGLYRLGTETTVVNDWLKVELDADLGGRSAVVTLPAGMKVVDLMVQLVDEAGNVAISSNKGPGYRSEIAPLTEAPAVVVDPPISGGFVRTAPTFIVEGDGPFEIVVDGVAHPLVGEFTVTGAGRHEVVVRYAQGGPERSFEFFTDSVPPIVSVAGLVDGGTYPVGSLPARPSLTCSDPLPGSGVSSTGCTAAGYTTTAGSHTTTITATDRAGNTAMSTIGYTVSQTYTFEGFFAPVDNTPIVNKVNTGANVPVKFGLRDSSGAVVTSTSAITSISSERITCSAGWTTDEVEEVTPLAVSSLRFDTANQRFQYNWKTDKAWAKSCRRLVIVASDGTTKAAYFNFPR